jgi:xanthine dehydrogenase accessory factor
MAPDDSGPGHGGPEHGRAGHVHDEACELAHGDRPVPPTDRRLVLAFVSPVAHELAELAERLRWTVVVLEPESRRMDEDPIPYVRQVATADLAGIDDATDVVVCDHDRPELGDVLAAVLARPTRWVGIMGSLRHTAPHVAALRERGVGESDIARVHRPIGLDIGSRTPMEIALSTMAGLLADRNGRSGGAYPAP